MIRDWPLLVQILRDPGALDHLDLRQWDLLIRQARHAELSATIAWHVSQRGLISRVPAPVKNHLDSARIVGESVARQVRWEVNRIQLALKNIKAPLVLLKGAAYELAELPAATGRVFFDVDVMVPKARLADVEKALRWHGWFTGHHDDYDDRYYRKWMHELPPMKHAQRQSVLDVHHTIIPTTSRLKPDAESFFQSAKLLPGYKNLWVLSPEDMVLHSATHLFCDGELQNGLRDLVDLDLLFRHFGADKVFYSRITRRAQEQGLTDPLRYAVTYCRAVLGAPIPDLHWDKTSERSGQRRRIMDSLFLRALMPDHPSCNSRQTSIARFLLFIRSHYLRMPLRLLIPHLLRKALRRNAALHIDTQP